MSKAEDERGRRYQGSFADRYLWTWGAYGCMAYTTALLLAIPGAAGYIAASQIHKSIRKSQTFEAFQQTGGFNLIRSPDNPNRIIIQITETGLLHSEPGTITNNVQDQIRRAGCAIEVNASKEEIELEFADRNCDHPLKDRIT